MSWRTEMSHSGSKWRLRDSPLAQPVNPIRFLEKHSCVYSIGSCFALNINRWLRYQGFAVPEISWGIHYNSRTILHEFNRAAGYPVPDVDWRVRSKDGTIVFGDALRHCVDTDNIEELGRMKEAIASQSRAAFERADAFFITLGLSDVWETTIDAAPITLNRAPYLGVEILSDKAVGAINNRFLTVDECIDDIRQMISLIRAARGATIPIVFTVSPVPLKHASGKYHPHIANSRSKSTLLSAIYSQLDEAGGDSFVSYFPSYEFFATNPLQMTLWQADDRHPSLDAINLVAEAFASSYAVEDFDVRQGFTIDLFS